MAETNVVALTEGLVAIANTTARGAVAVGAASGLREAAHAHAADDADAGREDPGAADVRGGRGAVAVGRRSRDQEAGPRRARQTDAERRRRRAPGCRARTRPARRPQCSQFLLAHHLAKVLAYTGEPDVIGRILAIMPKGDEDQPGQIDLMYSLRVIDTRLDAARRSSRRSSGSPRRRDGAAARRSPVTSTPSSTRPSMRSRADEKQMAYKAAPLFAPITEDTGGGGRRRVRPRRGRRGRRPRPRAAACPLDRQERYDNLVFPRGGGPGSLAGRGGAPNAAEGERRVPRDLRAVPPLRHRSARTTRRISPASPSACSAATSCARSSSRTRRSIRSTRRRCSR